jgi:hypothetical protein
MQGRRVAALAVVSATVGAVLVACFDLFHSTRDILTACEIDAQTPDCGADANVGAADSSMDAGGTDFCAFTQMEARIHAEHACAWLGACETPMGGNALGSCLFSALLAYDCQANPNHRVHGKTHQLWDCLSAARDCGEVERCVFPQGAPQGCTTAGDSGACGVLAVDGATINIDVRTECVGGETEYGENCALRGQTCASSGPSHACAGQGGIGTGCTTRGCFGPRRTVLQWCAQGVDMGLDCAGNGGQRCSSFHDPGDAKSWVACESEGDSSSCPPDASASCTSGIASSCLSGVLETINCRTILRSDAGCSAGPLEPPFDWTGACVVTPPDCDADLCTVGGDLVACVRGAPIVVDCVEAGLGPCHMASTDLASAQRAACARK